MALRKAVRAWHDRLQPFGEMYWNMYTAMRDRLDTMTNEELEQLIADSEEPDQGNCWFTSYAVAPMVRGEAMVILRNRQEPPSEG